MTAAGEPAADPAAMPEPETFWPSTRDLLLATVRREWRANRRDPKAQFVLTLLRVTQFAMGGRSHPRPASFPLIAVYRLITEWLLGLELRPKTVIGPGLVLYHGYGLVVNDGAVIGEDVVLRHGVTIGHAGPGGASPVIGPRVQFGAGAMALGRITIGADAMIGANSTVTRDVPAGGRVSAGSTSG